MWRAGAAESDVTVDGPLSVTLIVPDAVCDSVALSVTDSVTVVVPVVVPDIVAVTDPDGASELLIVTDALGDDEAEPVMLSVIYAVFVTVSFSDAGLHKLFVLVAVFEDVNVTESVGVDVPVAVVLTLALGDAVDVSLPLSLIELSMACSMTHCLTTAVAVPLLANCVRACHRRAVVRVCVHCCSWCDRH